MCEIFPEVETCCYFISVRVGMIFISVLAIITGCITLGVVEQKTNVGFDSVVNMYKNVSHVDKPTQALSRLSDMIATTISAMAVIFMLAGVLLLVSTLTDQEGITQLFVWLIFVNIVVGYLMILAIGFECMFQSACILGDMDWLSGSCVLIIICFYLLAWFYFICVANSYVLNGYV